MDTEPLPVVYISKFISVIDEQAARGKIRAFQDVQKTLDVEIRLLDKADGRFTDLPQIEGTNSAGHADSDTVVGRNQNVGE